MFFPVCGQRKRVETSEFTNCLCHRKTDNFIMMRKVTSPKKRASGAIWQIPLSPLLCYYEWAVFVRRVPHWIRLGLPHRCVSPRLKTFSFFFFFFFSIWLHYLLFTQVWCVMQTLECDVTDLLINPPSSPGWLRLQHLHVRRHTDVSALLSSRSEICARPVLVDIVCPGFVPAACFCWFQTEQGPREKKQNWFSL